MKVTENPAFCNKMDAARDHLLSAVRQSPKKSLTDMSKIII